VAADGDGISICPQPYQTESPIGPGDHNANTTEGALRKYVGVTRPTGKWISRVSYKRHEDERQTHVHLGTFPTAEMAAIAFDAAVLLLRGDSNANRLNFPEYSAHIKSILKGCSPSETVENVKYVGWKAAEELAPLISVGNKVRGFEVSPHVIVQPKRKDHGLQVSVAIPDGNSTAPPALLVSPTKGMQGQFLLFVFFFFLSRICLNNGFNYY